MTDNGSSPDPAPTGRPRFDAMTGERIHYADEDLASATPVQNGNPPSSKRWGRRIAIAALSLVILGVVGAGGSWWHHSKAVAAERAANLAEVRAQNAAESRRVRACVKLLKPTFTKLRSLDGRMNTGANEQTFSELVGDASAEFALIDTESVDNNNCGLYVGIGTVVEQYSAIASGWNDCIYDFDSMCDPDTDIDVSSALGDVSKNLAALGDDLGQRTPADDPLTSTSDISSDVTA